MSTIALPKSQSTIPARAKVAAGLALPLGFMNVVGVIVFWEWGWSSWVGVWGALMGAATLAGAVKTFLGHHDGVQLLRYAMLSQLVFTAMKLVFWQELEAASFGVVAAVVYGLLSLRRS
jgi:hypothetical protein